MPRRKELASSAAAAMSGTFTRSRSEIFLHRTRSGRARPDPKRRHPAPIPPRDERPPNSVKDLRLKRVFSGHSVMIDIAVDEKIGGSDGFDVSKGSPVDSVECFKETTPTALEAASESDGGNVVRVSDETDLRSSPEDKPTLSPISRSKVIGNPTSFSYRRLLPYLKDLAKDGSSGIEIVHSHTCSAKVEKPMKERTLQANSLSEQQNHDVPSGDPPLMNSAGNLDSGENPVLEQTSICSHEKVGDIHMKVESPSQSKLVISEVTSMAKFNNNMDEVNKELEGAKTESEGSDAGILQVSENPSPDVFQSTPPDIELIGNSGGVEFGSGKPSSETMLINNRSKTSLGLVSCSRSKLYRNPSSFSYRRLLPYLMDLAKNGSGGLEITHSQTNPTIVEDSIEERPMVTSIPLPKRQQQHSVTVVGNPPELSSGSEHQDSEVNQVSGSLDLDSQEGINNPVTDELHVSCNESKLKDLDASEIPTEGSEFEMFVKSSFCAPMISQDLSFEALAGNKMVLSYSPMETDRISKEKVHQLEAFGRGVNRSLAPRKGILKRQSRVCKGICMCLDCATFRVHAERAYEFSRRQMFDADEVISRLMKELSCMRNLMERSLPMVDVAEKGTVLQVNQDEVNGACQRAFRVEERAKSRVMQMFGDLNAHCKIPGSRVTFSDYMDEKNIP